MSKYPISFSSSSSSPSPPSPHTIQHRNETNDMLDQYLLDNILQPQSSVSNSNPRRRRRYIERDREGGHDRLYKDYFSEIPTYTDEQFRSRFRMRRPLFLRIVEALSGSDRYFQQHPDATGRLGLSTLQKCTAAIRMLAYGVGASIVDDYVRIGETTTRKCLSHFVDGIISLFENEYLRRPNATDLQRLLRAGEDRGFPGMIGSIDCMHWEWKNCPVEWQGQYARGSGKPTIVLEAVASYDLWIWHAFFGTPGTCNDINVLDRSPVFDDVMNGRAPKVNFVVNGHQYNMGYYLADGIYPQWTSFIQSIRHSYGDKDTLFVKHQESTRKDVERAFGVLQARFAIIRHPTLVWDIGLIGRIMRACVILHNMIVEDERDTYRLYYDSSQFDQVEEHDNPQTTPPIEMQTFIQNRVRIRDTGIHHQLKADLVEHIWQKFGTIDN